MRRYRVMPGSFDTRCYVLTDEIRDTWEPEVRAQHWSNRQQVLNELAYQYGEANIGDKLAEFSLLGVEPFSVLAYHNRFFRQARNAFVIGCYFPALTGVCALGERILNHLITALRDDFKATAEYKRVYRKRSFDKWDAVIDVLEAWSVLLPDVATKLRELAQKRNQAIHFRPETDDNARELALEVLNLLAWIIDAQFGANPPKPWYMDDTPGETSLKGEAESLPFVARVILPSPSVLHVGPFYELDYEQATGSWRVAAVGDGGPDEGSDELFLQLRRAGKDEAQ